MPIDRETAVRLHEDTPVFLSFVSSHARFLPDGRVDSSAFFLDEPGAQCSLPLLRRGGVNAILLSFGLSGNELFPGKAGCGRMVQLLSEFLSVARRHNDVLAMADGPEDIARVRQTDRTAVMLHVIGARIDGDLSVLEGFRRLGVRAMHCPFDDRQPGAGNVEADGGGLTPFGREVVREMDRLGIRVDVSHSSDEAFREILDIVEGPVIASHSNCRSLCDVSRNMTDEQIRSVGRRGGVIGIHLASGFIEKDHMDRLRASGFYERLSAWEAILHEQHPDPFDYLAHRFDADTWRESELSALQASVSPAPLSELIDHVDRMVELAGIDHVGVGTDYTLGSVPDALNPADRLPNLTHALLARGYSEADIRKIWSENFMRVFL